MRNKICIILTVIALTFLMLGAVSAAEDNGTIKNSKTLSSNVDEVDVEAPSVTTVQEKEDSKFQATVKGKTSGTKFQNDKVNIFITPRNGNYVTHKILYTDTNGIVEFSTRDLAADTYTVNVNVPATKNHGYIMNSFTLIVKEVKNVNNGNNVNKVTSKATKTVAGKKVFTITIPVQKIKVGSFYKVYRLKTGRDQIYCVYSTVNNAMMKKGISIDTQISRGDYVSKARLIKVKIAFKNKVSGKTVYKFYTKTNNRHDAMKLIKVPKGYNPIKATIWYRHK